MGFYGLSSPNGLENNFVWNVWVYILCRQRHFPKNIDPDLPYNRSVGLILQRFSTYLPQQFMPFAARQKIYGFSAGGPGDFSDEIRMHLNGLMSSSNAIRIHLLHLFACICTYSYL